MNIKKMMARCALACAALIAAAPAAMAAEPKPNDPCFTRVFEKTQSTGRWLVKNCETELGSRYQVEFRDAKLQKYTASFKDDHHGSVMDTSFQMPAGDTLAIEQITERGGQVFLLHPVAGTTELSTLQVPYMNPDEGGKFNLKQTGNTIRLQTNFDDVTVAVDPDGRLSKVNKPARKK
jgi:hypothetical protein